MMLPVDPAGFVMDDLRACHQAVMRFPRIGLVPVQWYWSDKPELNTPSVYGAWKWFKEDVSDYEYDDGQPGEVLTIPQPFVLGDPPDTAPTSPVPRGSPAAWMGEDTGESYLVQGYPCTPMGRAYSWGYSDGFS
jgi:hypothetical protein